MSPSDRVPDLPKQPYQPPINIGPIEAKITPLGVTPSGVVLGFKNPRQMHIRLADTFLPIQPSVLSLKFCK